MTSTDKPQHLYAAWAPMSGAAATFAPVQGVAPQLGQEVDGKACLFVGPFDIARKTCNAYNKSPERQALEGGDWRVQDVETATLNGRRVKVFKAFRRTPSPLGDRFICAGEFKAPARTADKDLWRVAAQG